MNRMKGGFRLLAALLLTVSAASGDVFDLAFIRDAATLEVQTLREWRETPGPIPTRQKLVEITVCEWRPGKKIRAPLIFVAPAEGPARGFLVADMSFRARQIRPNALQRALLSRGAGFVHAAIDRIDHREPDGRLQEEANAMFLITRDVRYTALWLWGVT